MVDVCGGHLINGDLNGGLRKSSPPLCVSASVSAFSRNGVDLLQYQALTQGDVSASIGTTCEKLWPFDCKCLKINAVFSVYIKSIIVFIRKRQTSLHPVRDAASVHSPHKPMKNNDNSIIWQIANAIFPKDRISATFRRNADPSKRNAEDRAKRSQNGQFDSLEGIVADIKWLGDGGVQVIIKKDSGGYGSLTSKQEIFKIVHNDKEITA